MDKTDLTKTIEGFTLKMFHLGSDSTNFQILNMLPTTPATIMVDLNLSSMPAYRRIKNLGKVGLLSHAKGTGEITSTELTPVFLELFSTLSGHVESKLPSLLAVLTK